MAGSSRTRRRGGCRGQPARRSTGISPGLAGPGHAGKLRGGGFFAEDLTRLQETQQLTAQLDRHSGVEHAHFALLGAGGFARAFRDKGRFSSFMESFSVHVIEDDYAALTGCAVYLDQLRSRG